MRYYVLTQDLEIEDCAVLSDPPKPIADKVYMFEKGTPLLGWFPADAQFTMDPEFPKARRLCGLQHNTLGLIVVSKEFKTALEEFGCENIEFLPISILNHRGKLASADYFIANVIGLTDCMDREKSTYKNNALIPTQISSCSKLVLREDAIPEQLHFFRLGNAPRIHVVTEKLKQELERRKLTGLLFVPVEEYNTALYMA
ncbi:imm11 family protein [Archangium lansingense]|uniref:imm11 family protein n=1 Tax=Archangium lansingense TaxID=2995310 RepID=UPI003B7E2363